MNTSIYIERVFDVEFDFQPFEPATDTYPGAVASVTINEIKLGEIDVTEEFNAEHIANLRDEVLRRHLEELRDAAESAEGYCFPGTDE